MAPSFQRRKREWATNPTLSGVRAYLGYSTPNHGDHKGSSLHSIMHPLSVALNPSPQAPAEDAPVSLTLSHSFQFIQGEPTRGLAGI